MVLRFGLTPRGALNTAAAAAAMGVSQRTVQRWLHAPHGRSLAHIPPARLKQLITLLLPSEETRERERQVARNAATAIEQLARPNSLGLRPAWVAQRWHEEHLVAVIEIKEYAIRQVAVARSDATKRAQLAKRGRIVAEAVVPTRFHATLVVHEVLTQLEPWRFAAGPGQVLQGFTQAWTADAPAVDLTRLVTALPALVTDASSSAPSRGETRKEPDAPPL